MTAPAPAAALPASAPQVAVLVGRWALPQAADLAVIEQALAQAERVVVVIGSAWRSRNPVTPFTVEERQAMLMAGLSPAARERLRWVAVRDVVDVQRWAAMLRQQVLAVCPPGSVITWLGRQPEPPAAWPLFGAYWSYRPPGPAERLGVTDLSAAGLCAQLFGAASVPQALAAVAPHLHQASLAWLADWVHSPVYAERCAEHLAVQAYRRTYPGSVYHTGDAVVEAQGRFLMIERQGVMGHGLWAFPGGHQECGETGLETAMRELLEETTLALTPAQLRAALVDMQVFDAPGRSPRGRIVTTACHFRLSPEVVASLPQIDGRDDAKAQPVAWVTRADFAARMHAMFDDHDLIGERFMGEMVPTVAHPLG